MFSSHTKPVDFIIKTQQSPSSGIGFYLCLRKFRTGKSHDYRGVIGFENLLFQYAFHLCEVEKRAF